MRSATWAILKGVLALGGTLALGTPTAQAQMAMPGSGRSLGGYGAAAISSYYGSGGGGYLPYTGGGGGFVPYRGGPGSGMGSTPIPRQVPTTPIGGASLSGAMGIDSRGGMGLGSRLRPRALVPFGYEGGLGGGMSPLTTGAMRRAPSGPGFGYPFRMPPSLTGGASMSMP